MQPFEQLEVDFGKWIGIENVVACSSGTAALHLALETLQLPPKSTIVVPDFTMVACARAVVLSGHRPVFVGCNADLLMDMEILDEVCSRHQPEVIMVVHIYGRQCDMNLVHTIARKHGCQVIEDLAEAHGILPHKNTEASCWSFYKNKIIGGEEGGAVAFKRGSCATFAKCLRSLGFTEAHDFWHIPRGMNYRMANCLAEKILPSIALGNESLKQRRLLEAVCNDCCPDEWLMSYRDVVWVYDFQVPSEKQDEVVHSLNTLKRVGINARHGFKPMSCQKEFERRPGYGVKNTLDMSERVVYLAIEPGITTPESIELAFDVARRVVG